MKVGLITGYGELGYSSIQYFFDEITRCFTALGSEVLHFELEGGVGPLLAAEPDVTVGIGTHYLGIGEQPTWESLKIPHVSWVIDSPLPMGISYLRSPLLHYATIDRQHSAFLESLGGACTFIPLGTRPPELDAAVPKEYDVVFTGHIGGLEPAREKWREYGSNTYAMLEKLVNACLADLHVPLLTQIRRQLARFGVFEKPGSEMERMFHVVLNDYLRTYKRVAVLSAIEGVEVHIFGDCGEESLRAKPNLVFHDPVPYRETFEVFRRARVAVNVSPNYYDGSHDRAIVPVSYGSISLTDDNPYLREHFGHLESMLFYRFDRLYEIDPLLKTVLGNPDLACRMARRAAATVAEGFTWERRCGELHGLCETLVRENAARRAVHQVKVAVDHSIAYLGEAAKSFRGGDVQRGSAAALLGFQKAAELIATAADVSFQTRFAQAMSRAVDAQAQGRLADAATLLEGEIVPLLDEGRRLFR